MRNDDTYQSCLNALMSSNFDINRENDDNETFLQRICLSQFVSTARINAMLEHQPDITRENLSSLVAKHAISKQRSNKKSKLAIQVVRAYVDARYPPENEV